MFRLFLTVLLFSISNASEQSTDSFVAKYLSAESMRAAAIGNNGLAHQYKMSAKLYAQSAANVESAANVQSAANAAQGMESISQNVQSASQGIEAQTPPIRDCPTFVMGSTARYTSYGTPPQDIINCGMDNCFSNARFYYSRPDPSDPSTWVRFTIDNCAQYCESRKAEGGMIQNGQQTIFLGCVAFSFAEIGGDQNHPDDTVCTLHRYADRFLNGNHGPAQRVCIREGGAFGTDLCAQAGPPGDPTAAIAYGDGLVGDDVKDCGLFNCGSNMRFLPTTATISDCYNLCVQFDCYVFSYAAPDQDPNEARNAGPNGEVVCTIHNSGDIVMNSRHPPGGAGLQTLCRNTALFLDNAEYYSPEYVSRFGLPQRNNVNIVIRPSPTLTQLSPLSNALSNNNNESSQSNYIVGAALLGLMSLFGGIGYKLLNDYKERSNYERLSQETV